MIFMSLWFSYSLVTFFPELSLQSVYNFKKLINNALPCVQQQMVTFVYTVTSWLVITIELYSISTKNCISQSSSAECKIHSGKAKVYFSQKKMHCRSARNCCLRPRFNICNESQSCIRCTNYQSYGMNVMLVCDQLDHFSKHTLNFRQQAEVFCTVISFMQFLLQCDWSNASKLNSAFGQNVLLPVQMDFCLCPNRHFSWPNGFLGLLGFWPNGYLPVTTAG